MKRFAVFGYGYNPNVPVCFVFAKGLEEAWEQARSFLDGRVFVLNVIETSI